MNNEIIPFPTNKPMTARERFALGFAVQLLQKVPSKLVKGEYSVACNFGIAVDMADGLLIALEQPPRKAAEKPSNS